MWERASSIAGDREQGVACLRCRRSVVRGEAITVCQACGTVHHQLCWQDGGGCASYVCSPARRELNKDEVAAVKITADDLNRAQAQLPPRPAFIQVGSPPPLTNPGRTSRLAIAALICAFIGIPLVGIPGLVAIVLGSLALGGIRHTRQRGTALALTAILLGLVDLVGWTVVLAWTFSGKKPDLTVADFRPDLTALENADPKIRRAMRANVVIEGQGPRLALGSAVGSGVIMKIAQGEALILTNRHVVDPDFAADAPEKAGAKPEQVLHIKMIDQSVQPGQVVWVAPGGIDLALVRCPCDPLRVEETQWQPGRRRLQVSDPVFAIGNPQGLGWTHTQGTISQFRIHEVAGQKLRVIQTQTAINPGNSGGGLYDQEGYLIGINTWTQDKRFSEGLNFAIALEALEAISPPGLDVKPVRPSKP